MIKSIQKQLALLLIGMVVLVLIVFLIINSVFLEQYYTLNKQEDLLDLHERIVRMEEEGIIEQIEETGVFQDGEKKTELRTLIEAENINFIIMNSSHQIVLASGYDNAEIKNHLLENLLSLESPKGRVLQHTKEFEIRKTEEGEAGNSLQYLQMWGYLGRDYVFMMQSPLESIRESVKISNRFMIYIGMVLIGFAAVLGYILAKRIADPIKELTLLSENMANLDFDAKYQGGGTNEISKLGENFNCLSDRLEKTISELKTANNELEKDIARKEKIEEMRTDFLGNVSHELKTPIALIQGYAEGLKEGIDSDPETREFYCEVIMDEAGKMNQMVKNLLTLNQLEFGEEETVFTRFDITALIRGVLSGMDILANQKHIRLVFLTQKPVYVWGDEFKVEQVIRNYVNNGLNHAKGDNLVEIKIREIDGKARMIVFNSGDQIPEEDIAHIWEKFYKVDKARTREYGGNGIGLSIVKAIMEGMNQKFGVQNFENGVAFWFELDTDIK